MHSEPYKAWISLYDDEIETSWEKEREELRKISMIYVVFQKELTRLQDSLSDEIKTIKSEFKKRDFQEKCKKFKGLVQSEPFELTVQNKENEQVPLQEIDVNVIENDDIFIESPNTSAFFQNSPPKKEHFETPTSPVISKNKLHFKKKNISSPSLVLYPVLNHKLEKQKDLTQTPKTGDDSNVMECSVIEDTPKMKATKKSKSNKNTLSKSKSKCRSQKTTLTQMFFEPKKKRKKKEIDSNMPSMEIDEIIDLINESSGSETDTTLDDLDTAANATQTNKNVPLSFIENYDKLPEKKSDSPKFAFKEVVRGKERKKLKGWSCKECENYYKGLDLPPEELEKKMNECSKHRSKFAPREETFKGFWDLTFGPSPKTQKQDTEESIIFNYKNH